jgi:hypothetical protein
MRFDNHWIGKIRRMEKSRNGVECNRNCQYPSNYVEMTKKWSPFRGCCCGGKTLGIRFARLPALLWNAGSLVRGRQCNLWRLPPCVCSRSCTVFLDTPTRNALPPTHTLKNRYEILIDLLFQHHGISTAFHQQGIDTRMRIRA